jgi:zinc/manganese transport system substrate-binding protein
MRASIGLATALIVTLGASATAYAASSKIAVVAAENFYGNVAQQIGGDAVFVTSILSNPDQDPHLFETSPSVVREIAAAQVVIYNGAAYDSWMERLLQVTTKPGRAEIVVADLVHKKAGDNPHLWYDPSTMPAVVAALATALRTLDPAHKDD